MLKQGKVEFERRIFPRFRVDLPIVYQHDLHTQPVSAHTGNVSRGGLLLCLEEPLAMGTRIRIKMHLTDPNAPRWVEAMGTIVWSSDQRGEDGQFHAGFAFEDIAEEHLEILREFEALWLQQGA